MKVYHGISKVQFYDSNRFVHNLIEIKKQNKNIWETNE